MKSSDFGTLYRGDLWTVLGLPPTKFNPVPSHVRFVRLLDYLFDKYGDDAKSA